jgi:hypothetical protein
MEQPTTQPQSFEIEIEVPSDLSSDDISRDGSWRKWYNVRPWHVYTVPVSVGRHDHVSTTWSFP